jgi:hypothetical protein
MMKIELIAEIKEIEAEFSAKIKEIADRAISKLDSLPDNLTSAQAKQVLFDEMILPLTKIDKIGMEVCD